MRVVVDQSLCSGHAQCAVAAPDLFRLDEDGYVLPFDGEVPSGRESNARAGARACPERALTVLAADPGAAAG
ncbi:ferredoxin [Streptomyces sp. M2CJ-2]|uniref:ferredoxin n=1 Tax=Streptomyces sp. M2CJ-2 TaxID=2803948 RepID=UPI00192874EA|nr:ferredoxin [Streptomyces sp. M2CJ-2]MBL3668064.1 ferredoxin [Streptomyces sp. M2CJ-2]